jgi:hypothetical protein
VDPRCAGMRAGGFERLPEALRPAAEAGTTVGQGTLLRLHPRSE